MEDVPLARQSVAVQVASVLRREVAKKQIGDRLETDVVLARRFNVSVPVVREALTMLVQDRIIERFRRRGTFVVDPTPVEHVALLLDYDITHPMLSHFYRASLRALKDFFSVAGMPASIYTGQNSPATVGQTPVSCQEFHRELRRGRITGVVAFGAPGISRVLAAVPQRNLPLVSYYCGGHEVAFDYCKLIHDAVERLARAGRTRLALLSSSTGQMREQVRGAFRGAVAEHGCVSRAGWEQVDQHPLAAGAGWDGFLGIWSHSSEKPDGLVVTDEYLFDVASKAILALRISVPDDLMICTHASTGSAIHAPFPVWRYEFDAAAWANTAGRIMLDLMRHAYTGPKTVTLGYQSVVEDGLLQQEQRNAVLSMS
jgi:DNA-binding LacI/PurR family transcriptional regulator